ncbi:lytic transglycosylase domain-containing protein [Camelimonas abortus]|uniref:Lytic transglycosylase domain-containing protein n=1 Tax=Camelimonas abortus TaxID=1017184 RepID=A0ABV7LFW8_9HYPH
MITGRIGKRITAAIAGVSLALTAGAAVAAQCGNGPEGFDRWLGEFRREAAAAGIRPQVIDAALAGVSYDRRVIGLDRNQRHFKVSFEQFIKNRVTAGRISKGRQMLRTYAGVLQRIESRYGVPPEILVAIWGMETDYGAVRGNMPVFRSLATLAYDCRRSAFFTGQLMDALRIVQRGDLSPHEMRGAWAGEIGQAQFLPSSYYRYAVDFDGDGHADLIRSAPDTLASIANYLRAHGWVRGAGYHPGQPNFPVMREWNRAEVYARALGYFADRLRN